MKGGGPASLVSYSFRTGILVKGWRIIVRVRKIKKKGKTKFCSKTMCTFSKWANKQTLKTELHIPFLPVCADIRLL